MLRFASEPLMIEFVCMSVLIGRVGDGIGVIEQLVPLLIRSVFHPQGQPHILGLFVYLSEPDRRVVESTDHPGLGVHLQFPSDLLYFLIETLCMFLRLTHAVTRLKYFRFILPRFTRDLQ